MSSLFDNDDTRRLSVAIQEAVRKSQPLRIRGSGSKFFYGRPVIGTVLDVSDHCGIVSYEPSELVLTVRSGTTLKEIEKVLTDSGQMLAFEPPWFGLDATIGGTIACGFSGPRRPFAGSARDYVLGVKIMNNTGESISFGGQVMKNVAGYDVSRLMTGAVGTLGVLLEISLKVLPLPEVEQSFAAQMNAPDALNEMTRLCSFPSPISAASYADGKLRVRMSGTESGVGAARRSMDGRYCPCENEFWKDLREQNLNFFRRSDPLWRISLPADSPELNIEGEWLADWAGALRWGYSPLSYDEVQNAAASLGGYASIFRSAEHKQCRFADLQAPVATIHARLKKTFDPAGIFNPGILYADL